MSVSNEAALLVSGNIPNIPEKVLRRFKGNFCGLRIPNLPRFNTPDSARDLLFTPAYPVYNNNWRAIIRNIYKLNGLTHFPISLFPSDIYHGLYPYWDGKNVNSILMELYSSDLIPVCVEYSDNFETNPYVNSDLVKIVYPQWEMNGPCENNTELINQLILNTKARYPKALEYVHFTPLHAAGGEPEASWWYWARSVGVKGILYQHDNDPDPKNCFDRCADFLVRFQGMNGWPTGLDFILYEYLAYSAFWQGMSEKTITDINSAVVAMQPASQQGYTGYFDGFCNGGKP